MPLLKYIYSMLSSIIPKFIFNPLKYLNFDLLQEIHLRVNCPVVLVYNSQKIILKSDVNINVSQEVLKEILLKASNYSIYSIDEQIKSGYVCLIDGIRIGLAGEFSGNNNLQYLQALNIRIPHQIKDCSKEIFNYLFDKNMFMNTLLLSPPGAGKTTMIRDILYQFNKLTTLYNVTIIDERNEITSLNLGLPTLETYKYSDIISHKQKDLAILSATKNLNPDIIVVDEITNEQDIDAINKTINLGVKILTSIHAENIDDLNNRQSLKKLIDLKVFKRFVVLSKINKVGEVIGIYDENFNRL